MLKFDQQATHPHHLQISMLGEKDKGMAYQSRNRVTGKLLGKIEELTEKELEAKLESAESASKLGEKNRMPNGTPS